jgi:hypothetical protein
MARKGNQPVASGLKAYARVVGKLLDGGQPVVRVITTLDQAARHEQCRRPMVAKVFLLAVLAVRPCCGVSAIAGLSSKAGKGQVHQLVGASKPTPRLSLLCVQIHDQLSR